MKRPVILVILTMLHWPLFSQQIADTTYHPDIDHPEYEKGKGPVVFIDGGHHNFHTKEGRYKAFANLLERDGYKVQGYNGMFEKGELSKGKILVISNALNEINVENWYLPTPSAFSLAEIETVKQWVQEGGSLFLIADHMPMAGASEELAKVFGFEFSNGFVMDTLRRGPAFFNRKEGTLKENIITTGRDASESIEQIATFTGQGFKIPPDANPILLFGDQYVNFLPDTAWVFTNETPRMNPEGWCQGAYKKFGKGRVVVFGEAAMFSAQVVGPERIKAGMNTEVAKENHQLLLNIIHWLDGRLE